MILATGIERFVIREFLDSKKRYYEAMVEPYPDWEIETCRAQERRTASIDLFRVVLDRGGEHEGPMPPCDSSRDVSFPIAAMVDVDRAWQQDLLELRREVDRLDLLDALLNLTMDRGDCDV